MTEVDTTEDSPYAPSKVFDRHVPKEFQRRAVEALLESVRVANDYCDLRYDDPEAHDLFPHVRRAEFDQRLRTIVPAFPGMRTEAIRNSRRTSYHTRVVSGRVILTQAYVETPRTIVREAEFRKTYATEPTLALSPDWIDEPEPSPDRPLYAILIHGRSDNRRFAVGFADVVFPSLDCKCYLGRIELFRRFPDLVEQSEVAEEVIHDDAQPTLRSNTKKIEGQ